LMLTRIGRASASAAKLAKYRAPFGKIASVRPFSSDVEDEVETMEYDVAIVGAGPAGLAAGIRLKQLCEEHGADLSVCLLEKGSYVGAHILSGNVFEPRALNELIPDWKEQEAPLRTEVKTDSFKILLDEKKSVSVPEVFFPK